MKRTIFTTPVLRTLLAWFASLHLWLFGWKIIGEPPAEKKYLMVSGPHTSNWDFYLLMMYMFKHGIAIHWLGKHTLFEGAIGIFSSWFGGIPVNRKKSTNVAQQVVDFYDNSEQLIVLVTPEGTRAKVENWKTGFYHIAHDAGIPIIAGFCDFTKKEIGIGPTWHTTTDVDKGIAEIKAFFATVDGKYPELGPD